MLGLEGEVQHLLALRILFEHLKEACHQPQGGFGIQVKGLALVKPAIPDDKVVALIRGFRGLVGQLGQELGDSLSVRRNPLSAYGQRIIRLLLLDG